MKILVCLSGGLDSATVLAAAIADGHQCRAIAFEYGQFHNIELDRAVELAAHYNVLCRVVMIPEMPKVDDVVFAGRNLVFASIAISIAQADGFDAVAFGCNASDWERFPDCRPEFWRGMDKLAAAYGVRVLTPLIYLSKRDVVDEARRLGVPIDRTWSCYEPQGIHPCGKCLACTTRESALNWKAA
jgi:7-cyano-7-deazaguanine synthase